MKKWNIVCDSSCDLTSLENLSPECDFSTAPLKITLGNQTFTDDISLNRELFVSTLKTNKDSSSSACPAPFDWLCQFETAENIIAITISRELR